MKVISMGANQGRFWGKTQMEMLEWCKQKCASLKEQKPDFVIFPEMLFRMYPQNEPMTCDEFYPIAVDAMKNCAREINSYIVFNLYEPHPSALGKYHNTTLVIDRTGEALGKYRKIYTVDNESLKSNVVPGKEPCVVDTEFGKIGLATCFDIGWRALWQTYEDMGVKAVIWTAAYDGGNLLDAYAITHMYWVISCVRTDHARIIDPLGREAASSACWDDLCIADIDLDMEIFHIDNQYQKINTIREKLGESVEIKTRSAENVFSISSRDPQWPVDRIKKEFGLVTYKEYHTAAEIIQNQWREKYN